ncbi:MAG TPA: SDR family oxidoreductase [Ktedonobacteraceae bacterium]|nr:SDR family oxidoreductase [Ktedonobacteraceae bacterium]
MPNIQAPMQGKICMITGANSGVGKATALGLAKMGATVVLVSRDRARGEEAQREIKAQSSNHAIDLLVADLSSQKSIRQLAQDFKQHYSQLHVLINNAGVFPLTKRTTVDSLDMTFAVNQLAPFLLTNLLLDVLKASAPARIVNVSSNSHEANYLQLDDLQSEKRYRPMRAYGQSKLALVLFTYELARRLEGTGVTANGLHPGFVATNIAQRDLPLPGRLAASLIFRFGISPEEGAKTSIYLASSPDVEGITGKYFVRSVPKMSAPLTYDKSLQQQLWQACAELTGLNVGVA